MISFHLRHPNALSFIHNAGQHILFFVASLLCVILKASYIGSFFSLRIFVFSYLLFYFSVYSPLSLSMLSVLLIGLIHDSIFNIPLGLSSFVWILWYGSIATQRRSFMNASVWVLWGIFSISYLLMQCCHYCIMVKMTQNIDMHFFWLEALFHVAFFPFGMVSVGFVIKRFVVFIK
jgi:cell shape-determining protein MreD